MPPVSYLAAQALTELGVGKAAKFLNSDPPVALDPAPGVDLTGLSPELLKNLVGSDHRIEFPAQPREGSNNWTIAGALTASGKPLLANDPHRVLALPSLRYMVHLVAPGWNVIGAGEPALPGVALGHNEHIAWGFTIFGLDQQDLYVEELNPANPLEYRTESGWTPMLIRREQFLIKGAATQSVDLKFTRHGPVLWEDGKRALALRWVGSEPGTAGYLASLAIDRAQNWAQFEAAAPRWKVPSENIVYADRAGNIGEHSLGLTPIRSWTGLLPMPGTGHYEWAGFLPTSKLPHSFNPAAGFVATANHRMIPDHYPYKVGFDWAPPYRFERIRSVIEAARDARHKLTIADMETLQNDVVSLPARELQILVRSTALRDNPAFTEFLGWDTAVTRESPPLPCTRCGSRRSAQVSRNGSLSRTVSVTRLCHPTRSSLCLSVRTRISSEKIQSSLATRCCSMRSGRLARSSSTFWVPTPRAGRGASSTRCASATLWTSSPGRARCSTSGRCRGRATSTR